MPEEIKKEETKKPAHEKNTSMAIVAYFVFFIPLLTDAKNDPFVKFHVKQGLVLCIAWVLLSIARSILPWELHSIFSLADLALFIFMVLGILSASKGEQKPLPLIGKFSEQFKF